MGAQTLLTAQLAASQKSSDHTVCRPPKAATGSKMFRAAVAETFRTVTLARGRVDAQPSTQSKRLGPRAQRNCSKAKIAGALSKHQGSNDFWKFLQKAK